MLTALLIFSIPLSQALFFGGGGGGGGGGCCCGCDTPQPASCGCQSSCPVPQCPSCPPPCPPPQVAICPQVQPVYIPASQDCGGDNCGGGGCSGGGCSGGSYGTAPGYQTGGGGGISGGLSDNSGYNQGFQQTQSKSGYLPPPQQVPASNSYNEQGNIGNTNAAYTPARDQSFRAQPCDNAPVKYIVLRKKVLGAGSEMIEEEGEEMMIRDPVESTAAPDVEQVETVLETSQGDKSDDEEDGIQSRSAPLIDAKCNSPELKLLITKNIVKDDAVLSKRSIHEAAVKKFPDDTVDIICSGTGFTYLVSTMEHCEAQKDNVICFIYKRAL